MVNKDLLNNILLENRRMVEGLSLVHRDFTFYDNFRYVLVGVRRAGKSFLLFQMMKDMLAKGCSWNDMLYLNFEDDRLIGFETVDFETILEVHSEMGGNKPALFLDEIQNIQGWEKFARRLADQKYRINITGSNAKMLSSDVATTLGGRYVIQQVFPYDFGEFCVANNVDLSVTENPNLQWFDEFFNYGGFPECATLSGKREYLLSVYQKIYLGDIAARYSIDNKIALRLMFVKLAESLMQPIAMTRLTNMLVAMGIKISKNTILNYAEYAKDAFLILPLKNIADNFTQRETNQKYYFVDNGIINLLIISNKSILLENLVALSLIRWYGLDGNVFFYNYNIEVDFVVPEKSLAVQVCYILGDDGSETYRRETTALVRLAQRYSYTDLYIVTYNEEYEIELNGLCIKVVPICKWLLSK